MPKFKTDHLFKLRLLLTYEWYMFLALEIVDWEMYSNNDELFNRLRAKMREGRKR